MNWLHLAEELPSQTRYWRKGRRDETRRKKTLWAMGNLKERRRDWKL